MTKSMNEKQVEESRIKCHNYGRDCMNNAVGEADLGNGSGVKFYCRKCMTYDDMFDIEDIESDDSLVFCNTEWEKQTP